MTNYADTLSESLVRHMKADVERNEFREKLNRGDADAIRIEADERREAAAEYRGRDEAAVKKLLDFAGSVGDSETAELCRAGLAGDEMSFEDAIELAEEKWGTA